jgi:hypothetical protein
MRSLVGAEYYLSATGLQVISVSEGELFNEDLMLLLITMEMKSPIGFR